MKETSDAIEAVANDDAQLAAICLSDRPKSELASSLLKCAVLAAMCPTASYVGSSILPPSPHGPHLPRSSW